MDKIETIKDTKKCNNLLSPSGFLEPHLDGGWKAFFYCNGTP
jgi:hypothetical protein